MKNIHTITKNFFQIIWQNKKISKNVNLLEILTSVMKTFLKIKVKIQFLLSEDIGIHFLFNKGIIKYRKNLKYLVLQEYKPTTNLTKKNHC